MNNTDPIFRSAIANLEKASTGDALRNALAKYKEPDLGPHISSEVSVSSVNNGVGGSLTDSILNYTGALPTLYRSHLANINNLTDPTWFDPPVIGPGDKLVDFNPDYKYIDQDGNELDF